MIKKRKAFLYKIVVVFILIVVAGLVYKKLAVKNEIKKEREINTLPTSSPGLKLVSISELPGVRPGLKLTEQRTFDLYLV